MKPLYSIISILLILLLASCSSGAGKFEGKWRAARGMNPNTIMIIEQKGDNYDLYPEDRPNAFKTFRYDSDHDLMVNTEHENMVISYDKETRHLHLGPKDWSTSEIELQKAD